MLVMCIRSAYSLYLSAAFLSTLILFHIFICSAIRTVLMGPVGVVGRVVVVVDIDSARNGKD